MRMIGRMTFFPCFCSGAEVAVVSVGAPEAVVSVGDVAVAMPGAEVVVSVDVGEPASGRDGAVPDELVLDGSAIADDGAVLDEAGSAAVLGAAAAFVS